jgi:uncharacterized protein (DUF1330 family)
MAKAYWIACYRSISNPGALAEYAKLAGPAIIAGGGRFLARGGTAKTYEAGIDQRTVLIEFPSVAQAIAAHDSPGYQAALVALGNAAERDMRIVEGVAKQLGLSPGRVPHNIERYANTTAGTLPILFHECLTEGRIKPGMLVCFTALGSGLHWGAALYRA